MAADLQTIITKVRRLTRTPSTSQMPDSEITNYINTAFLYDFPNNVHLESLYNTFTFYTEPYIDTYSTNTADPTNPMYNFKNLQLSSTSPVYIAGQKGWLSQSREQFYGRWPAVDQILQIGVGDGVTTQFTGQFTGGPILQNQVVFSSVTSLNAGVVLADTPVVDGATGVATQNGNLYIPNTAPANPPIFTIPINTINYVTGVFTVTFPIAPANGAAVNIQCYPYVPNKPTSILYFDDSFIVRPVPDQPYAITIEGYVLPSALINAGDAPKIDQWWQYLAFLAAKKILEDRTDYDSIDSLMPGLKEQELLVERRTLVQQGIQRSMTIYTDQTGLNAGPIGWWNNTL